MFALVIPTGIFTLVCAPDGRRCCLNRCEEFGAFGAVIYILGCLFECGCDILIQVSLSNSATHLPMQPATYQGSLFLAPGWLKTRLSVVCYLVFNLGSIACGRSYSSPQLDFGGFKSHSCMHTAQRLHLHSRYVLFPKTITCYASYTL